MLPWAMTPKQIEAYLKEQLELLRSDCNRYISQIEAGHGDQISHFPTGRVLEIQRMCEELFLAHKKERDAR